MKKVIMMLFMISFIFIILGIYLDFTKKIEVIEKDIEVYSEISYIDIDKRLENKKVNTLKLGNYNKYFYYKSGLFNKVLFLKINIIDTTKPYIAIGNSYTHKIGNDFKLLENVVCADNYDKVPNCKIEGEYDINQVGEYNVKYVAIDSSNNKTEIPFTLKIIDKINSSSSKVVGIDYQELSKYSKGGELMIDVSKWQEDIDYTKVKDAGINYVMIRIGTQKDVHKDSVLDKYFIENIENAKKNGLKVGVYYYSYASNVKEAKEQAKWVIDNLKNYKLDLPVAFDWEYFRIFNSLKISLYDLNNISNTFISEINKSGNKGILYSSKNYLENIWIYNKYDVWLAHYTTNTSYEGEYKMWQMSEKAVVPGVKTNCDFGFIYN